MTQLLIELDKAGAEWVVVGYLSGDANMLDVIEKGTSPHVRTGSLISNAPEEFVEKENKIVGNNTDPDTIIGLREPIKHLIQSDWYLPRVMSIRQAGKKGNHGLNYNLRYKGFALHNEIEEKEAKTIVELYHGAYPGIRLWHKTVQHQLNENRTLVNCFDRKRRFLDAWGENLFDAAYAFLPQSTVFDTTRIGMKKFHRNTSPEFLRACLLAQIHDSCLLGYNYRDPVEMAEVMIIMGLDYMNPLCVYNSREFYINTTMKIGTNWGDMYECTLSQDVEETATAIEQVIKEINNGEQET